MFENLVEILKANPRKIVYTEGPDARILESAARLKKEGFLTPILVGNVDEVKAAAEKGWIDEEKVFCEMAVSAFRAGADIYITYYAKELARFIQEGRIG